jgi:hypothetical protein
LLLVYICTKSRSVEGISANTITMYAICFCFRIVPICLYEGYLPLDSSGDFFYRSSEFCSLVCSGIMLIYLKFKLKNTYDWQDDKVDWKIATFVSLVLALLFHPSLDKIYWADSAWTFALYLESIAMFP